MNILLMRLWIVLLVIVSLSGIVFAAQETELGRLIFKDILQIAEYPTSFTGNIFQDLMTYILVPSAVILLLGETVIGRFSNRPFTNHILVLVLYLFIISSGLYGIFAIFAKGFFIYFVLFMGVLLLIAKGLGRGRGAYKYYSNSRDTNPHFSTASSYHTMGRGQLIEAQERLIAEINILSENIKQAEKGKSAQDVGVLYSKLTELQTELEQVNAALDPSTGIKRRFRF